MELYLYVSVFQIAKTGLFIYFELLKQVSKLQELQKNVFLNAEIGILTVETGFQVA